MDRAGLDSLDREGLIDEILAQTEAIERLIGEAAALRAEVAELRAKLDVRPGWERLSNQQRRAILCELPRRRVRSP
jgi:hypothetical protein